MKIISYVLFVYPDENALSYWAGDNAIVITKKCSEKYLKTGNIQIVENSESLDQITYHIDLKIKDSGRISVVYALNENYVVLASQLATHYKATGNQFNVIKNLKNKFIVRQLLNHDSPKYSLLSSSQKFTSRAYIVKPVDGTASQNVHLVYDWGTALDLYREGNSFQRLFIEEYIDGLEYSVECISFDSKHTVLGITGKELFPSTFVEKSHVFPAKIDPVLKRKIEDFATGILTDLDITFGITHIEIKVNGIDQISMIEINLRPGGDRITKLIELSLGVSLHSLLFNGTVANLPASSMFTSKICFFCLQSVEHVSAIKEYFSTHNNIKEYKIYDNFNPVDIKDLNSSADRSGYFIVSESNADDVNNLTTHINSMIGEMDYGEK